MAASTDKFKKLARRWVGQIGSGGVADASVTTIPLASTTNLPTDTAVVAVIDRVNSSGTTTASLEETIIGVVSGDNLVTCTRGAEGTAQAHSAGAVVEILVTAKGINDLIDGLLVQHDQAGRHTNITTCNITASGTTTASHVSACDITVLSLINGNMTASGTITASHISACDIVASGIGSNVSTVPLDITTGFYQPFQSYTPSASATATLNLALGNDHRITMPAGNITVALSNEKVGQKFLVSLTQDSGGSRTVTWFSTIKWAGGAAPTLTTTASKRDTLGFIVTGSGTYDGFVVGQNL